MRFSEMGTVVLEPFCLVGVDTLPFTSNSIKCGDCITCQFLFVFFDFSVVSLPRDHLKPAVSAIPFLPPFLIIAWVKAVNLSFQFRWRPRPYSTYGFMDISGNFVLLAVTLDSFREVPDHTYACVWLPAVFCISDEADAWV